MCLHKEAFFYLLSETTQQFHPDLELDHDLKDVLRRQNGELFHVSIDNSNHKLRMYGSAEELRENINIYENFPGNHEFFGISGEPYQTNPIIFKSLKNDQKYIAKSDLFVILQNMIVHLPGERLGQIIRRVVMFLKSKQARFKKVTEFVKFDEARFEEMYEKMKEDEPKRKLSPEDTNNLRYILFQHFANVPPGDDYDEEEWATNYRASCILIDILKEIIDENPDLFLPRTEDSGEPITVRVFEDGNQQFLMTSEVSEALKANLTLNKLLETISLEEVFKNFDSKNIEFIRYPILRAKHRATPIPISTQEIPNEFCILAIDTFFEFFKELILGFKYFQKADSNLQEVLTVLKVVFELDCTTPYFLRCDETEKMLDNFMSHLKNVPAKNVRNAKSDGFTVQNLKNELAYLGLTAPFPEIQDYAEVVYAEVEKRKKEEILRSCDLFDAVEHCQLNCILERLPELKTFVHNQKGCHRVYGFKCEECAAENAKNQENQKLSILEKELEELKIAYQKVFEERQQKSLEIQDLHHKIWRLSVKNETNEVKMKQLTEKLTKSELSIDCDIACTSSASQLKIQCLICEKSIESGEVPIIRCPLCKRRFHSKCAINWLKEHKECPACNGDIPKD
ncbi:hypothetical protein B9Z55_004345 [Caenorhabditis nigoni]|nr:hypothetical protein B9Z55_004345 [Caenorhabditis nigoni]